MRHIILRAICLAIFAFAAMTMNAQDEIVLEKIHYNIDAATNTAAIISADDNIEGAISIPANITYNGISYKVTSIGERAFCETNLTSISIPATITEIGIRAFGDCKKLESAEILTQVETIPQELFAECTSLRYVSISESVKSIGDSAFYLADGANFICYSTTPPVLGDYAIANQSNANLYITEASVEQYKSKSTWNEFKQIYAYEKGFGCAIPEIDFVNGKIVVTCATEGAKCVRLNWKLTGDSGATNSDFTPKRFLEVEAEVAAEGYQNTTTKKTLNLTDINPIPGDVDGNGKLTINDIVLLVNRMQSK